MRGSRTAVPEAPQPVFFETASEAAKAFRARPKAGAFFQAQPPGYERTATFWVMSAKNPETRHRRLAQLIDDSEKCRRLGMLSRPETKK